MKLPVYQVDTFATQVFAGNPAVVCCLTEWLDDTILLAIAAEHNTPDMAFLVDGGNGLEIRYFTSSGELPLVGHASLAAAYVLLRILRPGLSSATLRRRNGSLVVSRLGDDLVAIRLPKEPSRPCAAPAGLANALGAAFESVQATDNRYFVLFDHEAAVRALAPDMDALIKLDCDAVIATAPGDRCEFVSRAFAPKEGLREDPVCGSAHLTLVPLWSDRLGRTEHLALQLSPRGGKLHCSLDADEVRIAGNCALYLEGSIHI